MQFRINFSGKVHNYTENEINSVALPIKAAEQYTQATHLKQIEERSCESICNNNKL